MPYHLQVVLPLSVGEPSLGRFAGGDFDFTPLLVAAAILLMIKVLLGIRIRWQLILGTLLAAPLLVALSDRVSYAMTAALVLAGALAVAAHGRRHSERRVT
jgi:hypothetical protein